MREDEEPDIFYKIICYVPKHMKNYDHTKIEKKWQKDWDKKKIYKVKNTAKGKKFYGLIEFPYPSGAGLHVGHIRSNTAMDIITRKRRMEGYNVLFPIGWDAFGLPTENYAIKTGIQPEKVTKQNTDVFRKQLKEIGFGFDWSREVNTTDPKYYKWTQWIFLQMYKKGLAYKAKSTINWCPKDKIGLANEEVVNGACERCGTPTIKKEKEQWMLGITKYADRLDKDLDNVDYLEKIKIQQRNWIGKSEGSEIEFKTSINRNIKVFTTRADTLFGVTYVVLSPEHENIGEFIVQSQNMAEASEYIREAKVRMIKEDLNTEKEKTGIELKGIKAINPVSGEEVPVWIADYVYANYGTGAVMAVPAHDERDFEFAKKYKLPIKQVIAPHQIDTENPPQKGKENTKRNIIHAIVEHPTEKKVICLKWKDFNWRTLVTGGIEDGETAEEAAKREVIEETGFKNLTFIKTLPYKIFAEFYAHHKNVNRAVFTNIVYFKLEDLEQNKISEKEKLLHEVDWIDIKDIGKLAPVSEMEHIIKWLKEGDTAYTGEGVLINSDKFNELNSIEACNKITKFVGGKIVTKYKLRDWVFSRQRYWGEPIPMVNCEKCGYVPVSEKDLPVTLPKVKSYIPTDNGESPLAIIDKWVNTKCPKCKGKAKRETDTMPNWAGSSWYFLRYTYPKNNKEFASKKSLKYWMGHGIDWYNGGMEHTTLHLLYSRFWHKFLYDLKLVPTSEPYMKRTSHGMILAEGGAKMSKSLGNTVDPKDIVKLYGADTLRVYEMFMGPFDQAVSWSTESIIGSRRFIERVYRLNEKVVKKYSKENDISKVLHKTIKKVTEDIESMNFNTAISSMMVFLNEADKVSEISIDDFKKFLQILSPFAPHISDELWNTLGEKKSIHISSWPKWDKNKVIDDVFKIVVQVNGKVRAEIRISRDMGEDEIKAEALKDKAIIPWIEEKEVKRVIYVKDRLVNIVV